MEIKLDKTTLPKDGAKVRFLHDDKGWLEGTYNDTEELFIAFNGNQLFASQASEWEYLDESQTKSDWYSRYRRMVESLGHTHKDVASIIEQTESSVNGFSRNLPRQMRYAVVVWETMQKKIS